MSVILSVLKRSGAAKKAAGVLAVCFLGMAVAYGGLFHVGKNSGEGSTATPAEAEKITAVTETVPERKEPRHTESATAEETVPEETLPEIRADRFNLVSVFPEDADQTDPLQSYGGKVFRKIYERDNSWNETVFGASSRKPLIVAGSLGISRASLMGKYNITDKNHDPLDPSTWVIGKWTKISLDIRDGDGRTTPQSSNVKEILAMASVYTYYHDMEDAEAFENYARRLWSASHSSSMSVSDVYYDKDCLTKEAIDRAVSKGRVWPASASNTDRATPSDPGQDAPAPDEAVITETSEAKMISAYGTEASGERGPGILSVPTSEETSEAAAAEGVSIEEGSVTEMFADGSAAEESSAGSADQSSGCPGHVDLAIKATVWSMEGKRNLFTLDKIGNNKANFNDRWQGWTEERIQEAKTLAEADWYQDYGLSVSLLSGTAPLTEAEIEEQMALLPADLSEERKALARTALGSIGRIPYYYGGKAVSAEYEENNFYTVIRPDYKGRVFRGLDCSGWLAWVYWNTTGEKLAASSTAGQIHLGRGIRRSELRTGDIIIRAGNDETMGHVLMFLRWDESGQALCIHETGGITNNVSFKLNEDVGASCRDLVDP